MKHLQLAAALAGSALIVFSSNAAADKKLEAKLKSYSEVPSVSSVAAGRFKARVDEGSGVINYELSYSGLESDVRQAHIHFGQRHTNGGVSVFLCQTTFNPDPTGLAPPCPQAGTVIGKIEAANVIGPGGQGIAAMELAELIEAIRAGAAYVNVHSVTFPGGEIRGQLDDDD